MACFIELPTTEDGGASRLALAAAILLLVSGAETEAAEARLFPKADVVLTCTENGTPKAVCSFICGGGFSLSFDTVSRVEIYAHGFPGRTDQRVWIAVEHLLNNPRKPDERTVSYVYGTPSNACNWESVRLVGGNSEIRREFKIEKFDQ